jgi:hypothetical protein
VSAPEHDELDASTRDYLAAFIAVEQPSKASTRASWAAIDRATSRRPSATPWIAVGLLVAAALLLALFVDWRALVEPTRQDAPSQAPYEGTPMPNEGHARETEVHAREHRPERTAEGAGDAGAAAPVAEATSDQAHAAPEPTRARRSARRDNAQPVPIAEGPSALAEETALLGEIQKALVAGRPNDALHEAAEHRKRFPKGAFTNEVTIAKAEALCALGQPAQSRAVVETFLERHPTSHLVTRAKRICAP